jgi:hypothetical protein
MMWVSFIIGALMFVFNVETVQEKTEDGATAYLYTALGLVLMSVSALYLSGVVS